MDVNVREKPITYSLGTGSRSPEQPTASSFRLSRGQQPYGTAILADVRRGVSGLFVESLDNPAETPRPGDLAILETQASAQ